MLIMVALLSLLFTPLENNARNFRALYYKSMGPNQPKPKDLISEEDLVRSYDKIPLTGSIKVGSKFLEDSAVRIYYKGDIIPCTDGIFELFESAATDRFDIAICLCSTPKTGIIKSLEVPTGADYTLFSLEKKEVGHYYQWKITQSTGKGPYALPEKALVVMLDATCVQTMQSTRWSADTSPVPLPTLILKKNSKTLQDSLDKAALAALDSDTFHKKLTHNVHIGTQKQITLAQEINV